MKKITLSDYLGNEAIEKEPLHIGVAIIGPSDNEYLSYLARERCLLISPEVESMPLILVVPGVEYADNLKTEVFSKLKNCIFEDIDFSTELLKIIHDSRLIVQDFPKDICLELKMLPMDRLDNIILREDLIRKKYPKHDTYKPKCNYAQGNNKYYGRKSFASRKRG